MESLVVSTERASQIFCSKELALAIFAYRVARMVQEHVRADPARSMEGTLLAQRQRMQAADNLSHILLALLEAPADAPAGE